LRPRRDRFVPLGLAGTSLIHSLEGRPWPPYLGSGFARILLRDGIFEYAFGHLRSYTLVQCRWLGKDGVGLLLWYLQPIVRANQQNRLSLCLYDNLWGQSRARVSKESANMPVSSIGEARALARAIARRRGTSPECSRKPWRPSGSDLQQSESTPPEDRALGWPTDQVSLVAGMWGFSHEKRPGQGVSGLARRGLAGVTAFLTGGRGRRGGLGGVGVFPGRFQPVTWATMTARSGQGFLRATRMPSRGPGGASGSSASSPAGRLLPGILFPFAGSRDVLRQVRPWRRGTGRLGNWAQTPRSTSFRT